MIGVGTFKTSPRARKYVNDVLNSERISYGPYTQKFESLFAASHDCKHGIMTNSGSCALILALAELKEVHGWEDGDEVIVPALTFVATSNIVIQNNMKPVFVDIEPKHYSIDPEQIEAAITERTRCIIPVHLFGSPCDMDPIMEIARKHDLKMIEDTCETMFVKYKGRSVGSFGDVGCFSTYVAHILTTGVGGLCTTNDSARAIGIRSLMNHGRDSIYLNIDDDKGKGKEELNLIIKKRFQFPRLGYSFRVSEFEGALGLAEFEDHEDMMQKRWDNGHYFMEKLAHLDEHLQLPCVREGCGHAFMMFPVVLRHQHKKELVQFLEQNGIETRDMVPLTNQPFYNNVMGVVEDDFPNAKWVNNSGFYIASHQSLSMDEKEHIVDTFQRFFEGGEARTEQGSCLVVHARGNEQGTSLLLSDPAIDGFSEKLMVGDGLDPKHVELYRDKGFQIMGSDAWQGDQLTRTLENLQSPHLIFISDEGAEDPEDLERLRLRMQKDDDMVIASRFIHDGVRYAPRTLSYRSVGHRFLSFLVNAAFNTNLTDTTTLFRGIRKRHLLAMNFKERDEAFFFEMTVQAIQGDLRIREYATVERPGVGEPKQRNRLLTGLICSYHLLRQAFGSNKYKERYSAP